MSARRNEGKNSDAVRNNLRKIEGLGPKSARALRALGITNCTELVQYLAQHSPRQLSERLAEQGVQVAAKKIESEDWLGQARRIAAQLHGAPMTTKTGSGAHEKRDGEPTRRSSLQDEVCFTVRFRREHGLWKVKTYDERLPVKWEAEHDTDPAEWANWILAQMRRDSELGFPPTETWTPTIPELEVLILDARHYEAERSRKLGAEVRFEVSGSKMEALAQARTRFWVHVHTVELQGESAVCVASMSGQLEPEVFTYEQKLEYPFPKAGRYQLCSLVLFPPPLGAAAFLQGPTLNVRP